MKILLLNPPGFVQSKFGRPLANDSFPGLLGLGYLYSFLKKYDYDCKVYDFYFDNWDHIERILREEKAKIIGITCLTQVRFNAFRRESQLSARIKLFSFHWGGESRYGPDIDTGWHSRPEIGFKRYQKR